MSDAGVYAIEHKQSGKKYIGSSKDLKKRLSTHRRQLRAGTHVNEKLQRAWSKYGEAAFAITILEGVADLKALLEREQFWLDRFDAAKTGYNISPTAGTPLPPGPRKPHSEATKSKIRAKRAEQIVDPTPMHRANTGRKRSAEARAAIAAGRTGLKHSVETRAKIAAVRLGSTMPEETRQKIAAALKGREKTDETRARLAAANTGKKLSPETIAKRTASRRANAQKQGKTYAND